MGLCFVCDSKLYGERTRVCSSITPHSNVPYPEKLVELLGEEFVVIVTPSDHMCKKCTSLLTHLDKLENDLKLVKNALVSYIQKKYGILPPDQPVKTLDVVNGHLKTEELEVGQRKVPSGLTIRDNTASVHSPLKMLKPQQQSDSSSKLKIYKCGFCTFQSKELGHVRFHMRTHMNKKDGDKTNQSVPKQATPVKTKYLAPTPQKKRLYRCQVCSKSFDSRMNCLDHIQKDHNQNSSNNTAANEGKEIEDASAESKTLIKPELPKPQENQEAETTLDTVNNQQDAKGTVDTDMLLNDSVPAEGGTAEQEEEPENAAQGDVPMQDASEGLEEAAAGEAVQAQEEAVQAQEDEPMQVDQEILDNEEKGVEDMAVGGEENKTGDLDIESMLAAIHNDNPPPNDGDQNIG